MWPRKRLLSAAIILIMSLFYTPFTAQAGDEETHFVVTAYYSPLPGQSKYTTWSYYWDIRLNGEWVTTASGKWVFQGLLAWPANYPFGTKIYFEWFWIWVIEDRWWAIVKAGERWHSYDRIDVWMWYGDEWLKRALNWWTRTVKGKIVVPSSQITLWFWESSIGSLTKLTVNPESSDSDDVKKLQEIFKKAGLYNGEIDGKYSSIQDELIDFQISQWVISWREDESAGWYGPKTIAALREEYWNNEAILISEPKEDFSTYNHKQASGKYKVILEYGDLQVDPDSNSEDIEDLQRLMSELWEYAWSINGKYSSIETPLIQLQQKIGLIHNEDDWGAWYFWNKTKSALWEYYEEENDRTLELSDSDEEDIKEKIIIKPALLNDEDKRQLSIAVNRLRIKRGDAYINKLSEQIDSILPRFTDELIRAKIEYIAEIIK